MCRIKKFSLEYVYQEKSTTSPLTFRELDESILQGTGRNSLILLIRYMLHHLNIFYTLPDR